MSDSDSKKPSNERRRFRRIPVTISVGIFAENQPVAIDGEISNISLGGAFIRTDAQLSLGAKVLIELKFKESLLVDGKVVNRNELEIHDAPNAQQASIVRWVDDASGSGFGIEFENLDPKKREAIQKIIRYYDLLKKAGVKLTD